MEAATLFRRTALGSAVGFGLILLMPLPSFFAYVAGLGLGASLFSAFVYPSPKALSEIAGRKYLSITEGKDQ